MTKLYEKDPLYFALAWITGYVVLASTGDSLSEALGILKIVTVPVLLVMTLVLSGWMIRRNLKDTFGLCAFRGQWADFLWFVPLGVLVTVNLWNGVAMNHGPLETALFIVSMLLVGFLEEVIFRGLLFSALCKNGLKSAFVISSLTFGIGHIVNLLNGAEFFPTLLQVVYAMAIGFLFTLIFHRGKSLWPCIITHGLFNSMSVFGVESDTAGKILSCLALCLIPAGYALWIWKRTGKKGR